MKHRATRRFWNCYEKLPDEVQRLADKSFELLKQDAHHSSLQLKRAGRFFSVRIGLSYRALAVEAGKELIWFWIGSHAEYDKLVSGR